MLLILEATSGPIAGRRIEVRGGASLRLGRTAKADYAIGEDPYLSGQHFAVECDHAHCRIRDLGSSNGTFLNGKRVTEDVVNDGDSLVAGGTTFAVHVDPLAEPAPVSGAARVSTVPTVTITKVVTGIEGLTPAGTSAARVSKAPSQWPGFSESQARLLSTLYRGKESVFAVLDPSRDSRIPAFLEASGDRFAAIGDRGQPSPFLVELPASSRLLDVLIKDGWAHNWGFYCMSLSGFEEARQHWKTFLAMHNELGQTLTFRFWDPRVLRVLVPLMTPQESVDFFGPIVRMVAEGEKPGTASEFLLTTRGPKQQSVLLYATDGGYRGPTLL